MGSAAQEFYMSHVHVCLVSDQPIPNLTSIFQMSPEEIFLLTTKEMEAKAIRLKNALQKQGIVAIDEARINAYNIDDIIDKCESVIENHIGHYLTLNITGGTKIATIAALQVFKKYNLPIYYVNTFDNEIIELTGTDVKKLPINAKIPIETYLSVYGFNIEKTNTDLSGVHQRSQISNYLAAISGQRPKLLGTLNYNAFEAFSQAGKLHLPDKPEFIKLCDMLVRQPGVQRKKRTHITISDDYLIKYLNGFWLEEYVYICAKEAGADEALLQTEGKWDVQGRQPKNELDVLFSKGNRLFFISCKTSKMSDKDDGESISREYIYELDSIGDEALGIFGKKMLVSARPIADEVVKNRAASLKITIMDSQLTALTEKLKLWLMK